ncbi:uncharacterized protein K460DRAFT_351701 [Cucurbitaria berberidis CBS 394.84]|uniref:Uncharacterized protein n=1 Tax=Cucurbitaria berberidis CBS 394.84 TaxID=1168544 RepID=A0A9P4GUL9_9PLEO|nr:uncharacterized protein K460DRAFT_351701 [Cucurbitaria berberidis CBS 394.84]KAF1851819.1 hypothetical protein K460DRAFT_351701 [Cucurbitaria berberidis CBS 394.84]
MYPRVFVRRVIAACDRILALIAWVGCLTHEEGFEKAELSLSDGCIPKRTAARQMAAVEAYGWHVRLVPSRKRKVERDNFGIFSRRDDDRPSSDNRSSVPAIDWLCYGYTSKPYLDPRN